MQPKQKDSRPMLFTSKLEQILNDKHPNRLDRNYLKGTEGDRMNAILSGCGFNIRKLLRKIIFWLVQICKNMLVAEGNPLPLHVVRNKNDFFRDDYLLESLLVGFFTFPVLPEPR